MCLPQILSMRVFVCVCGVQAAIAALAVQLVCCELDHHNSGGGASSGGVLSAAAASYHTHPVAFSVRVADPVLRCTALGVVCLIGNRSGTCFQAHCIVTIVLRLPLRWWCCCA